MILHACETCKFYRVASRWSSMKVGMMTVGECRKSAPDSNGWPFVTEDDWCGAYTEAEEYPIVEGITPCQ